MATATSRELTQVGPDLRTRTFRFNRDTHGSPWMSIEIRNAAGQSLEAADYHFTDEEFEQFCRLVELVR